MTMCQQFLMLALNTVGVDERVQRRQPLLRLEIVPCQNLYVLICTWCLVDGWMCTFVVLRLFGRLISCRWSRNEQNPRSRGIHSSWSHDNHCLAGHFSSIDTRLYHCDTRHPHTSRPFTTGRLFIRKLFSYISRSRLVLAIWNLYVLFPKG